MIYSYIALILFIKPNIIGSAFNTFLIYFFPYFLYIGIIVYILKIPKLFIFFKLTVYPEDDLSRLLNYFLIFIFLLINIINNLLLIYKIKKFINKLHSIDSFAKEKLSLFRKKLIFNIVGMIFVFHYILPVGILTSFKIVSGGKFFDIWHFLYIYINKAILGIVFWFIYIYNTNFGHKLLILIRIEKKEKFEQKFEKEEKLLEYSIDESLRANETININMDDLENINSVQNRISFKSSYEDEQL
jgi:hypothetical protein